ncbi:protoporphyrinogen/coproporphyrinogen oxidase [Demequina sediminicola]|uniref:protoporphyrinogen/coproporphyrinogen oxidase n=1 Tax=Demequina sediminicola TaxID=1095026 RepID=UPI00078057AD|nr:FAD-dependent oxidoreductase [Demequina sediminicola]
MTDPRTWIVIGAGPAGLLAACRLADEGHSVTVLEAESELGGRVSKVRVDGIDIDAGAESFATRGGHVEKLIDDIGLTDKLVAPAGGPAWIVGPDRSYPMPAAGWLGIPTKSLSRDVRKALGWSGALRAAVERWMPVEEVAPDDHLGEVARRRLGDIATDRLLAPVVSGIFSRPIDELRIDAAAAGFAAEISELGLTRAAAKRRALAPAGASVMGLEGGMFTLTDVLAERARARGVTIYTDAPVYSLTRSEDSTPGGRPSNDVPGWDMVTESNHWHADEVVMAASRPVAASLVPQLERAPDRQVGLVTLSLDAPELDSHPRGSGVLAVEGVTHAKALTHASAKWNWVAQAAPSRHIIRLSYNVESAQDLSDYALADASRLLGVPLKDQQVRDLVQVTWHDAAPTRAGDREPAPGLHLVGSAAGFSGLAAIADDDARSTLGART